MHLGTLYDCRSDSIIANETLWCADQLQKHRKHNDVRTHEFKVVCNDSMETRAELLGATGDVKLSLYAGLVTPSGSAKYWNDRRESSCQVFNYAFFDNYSTSTSDFPRFEALSNQST